MPGGPPTYRSREEEQEIEEKLNIARVKIAEAYALELEKIVESAPVESRTLIADAVYYVFEGFVYGLNPAQRRIEELLNKYKSERVSPHNFDSIKKRIWQEEFKE